MCLVSVVCAVENWRLFSALCLWDVTSDDLGLVAIHWFISFVVAILFSVCVALYLASWISIGFSVIVGIKKGIWPKLLLCTIKVPLHRPS